MLGTTIGYIPFLEIYVFIIYCVKIFHSHFSSNSEFCPVHAVENFMMAKKEEKTMQKRQRPVTVAF